MGQYFISTECMYLYYEHRNVHASGCTEIHNVVQADLKLQQCSCLRLQNAGITGVICHAWFMKCWDPNPELCARQASTPSTEVHPQFSFLFLTCFCLFEIGSFSVS